MTKRQQKEIIQIEKYWGKISSQVETKVEINGRSYSLITIILEDGRIYKINHQGSYEGVVTN